MSTKLNFFESNVCLKEKTYYKMGGVALIFATPNSFGEIVQTIHYAKEYNLPIAVLGAGSNCVFSDEKFEGIVISLSNLTQFWWETEEYLFAESGVTNTDIANICLETNRAGASWMYKMPGQIGASVRMNARCYGGETSQIVSDILTIDKNGYLKTYQAKEIFKGYKSTSLMQSPEIVVGVRFYFPTAATRQELRKHMDFCEDNRNSKYHFLYPSCGSTFKNNHDYGKPSGQIFDELGFKGTKRGDAEVSVYHGNFIWNTNRASTKDLLLICAEMKQSAFINKNVELNLEVQPIGEFTSKQVESCNLKGHGPYVKQNDKYQIGLFDSPHFTDQQEFPKTIFSSFFTEYFKKTQKSFFNVKVQILQLMSLAEAKKNPQSSFLRWLTLCDQDFQKIFDLKPEKKESFGNEEVKNGACTPCTQKLWEFSVSELFIAHPFQNQYLELEMTPTGEHLLIDFEDIRKRRKDFSQSTLISKNDSSQKPTALISLFDYDLQTKAFGLEISYQEISHLIHDSHFKIQCALSLGHNQYYLAPFWKQMSSKTDFHNISHFFPLKLAY